MHFVKDAKYAGDHRVELTFEDGTQKTVDLGPYLEGEIFQPLRDPKQFSNVKVSPDIDTIYWDNGADFSPDFLYNL